MNLGDNLLLNDIVFLTREEAEEALMVMRYMFIKETAPEKKASYLRYIEKVEARLNLLYGTETVK